MNTFHNFITYLITVNIPENFTDDNHFKWLSFVMALNLIVHFSVLAKVNLLFFSPKGSVRNDLIGSFYYIIVIHL